MQKRLSKKLLLLLIFLMILGAGLGIWSVLIEPAKITYPEYSIHVRDWPKELSGYSIAFLSDTHVGSPHIDIKKMQEIVGRVNDLHPDLILLGGDYTIHGVLGGRKVPYPEVIAVLGGLKAANGVYGVLGNHDWWENGAGIREALISYQVTMLEDEARYIKIGDKGFWLGGVSDFNESAHDVAKTLSSIGNTDPVLLFSHSPDIFPDVPKEVALTMAGHTHGGQVYVPLIGRPITASKYGQRYARGLIEEEGKQLFVCSGIGTSILPIRFMTKPEICILKLYPL